MERCEIPPKMSRASSDGRSLAFLRSAMLIAIATGAVGSLVFMFHVGRRQRSIVLIILFTAWVLSPFLAFFWADVLSKRWSAATRATLYIAALLITSASLLIYGVVALGPPRPQPASAFLVVPLASWLLIAIVVPIVLRSVSSGNR